MAPTSMETSKAHHTVDYQIDSVFFRVISLIWLLSIFSPNDRTYRQQWSTAELLSECSALLGDI